jgi:hypothetical protein
MYHAISLLKLRIPSICINNIKRTPFFENPLSQADLNVNPRTGPQYGYENWNLQPLYIINAERYRLFLVNGEECTKNLGWITINEGYNPVVMHRLFDPA